MKYLWTGELGNLSNYGICRTERGYAFVWTNGSLPKDGADIENMKGQRATADHGAESFEFLGEAVSYAREIFEELEDEELLTDLESFSAGTLTRPERDDENA